jgi:polyhydroxyalkanoic acid synthase PhaR subunit
MTIRTWTNAMNNSKIAGMDNPWMELANTMQKRVTNNVQALLDPREAWKLWFEATMDIWRGAAKMGGDPLGMIAGWVKVMENVQERTSSGGFVSFDPFTLFNEWYDATSKPWASTVEDLIASEQFLAFTDPFLESYSHLTSTFRDASEAYFKMLRLPTLSDIARMAELIISLEEKVDAVAETIERAEKQTTRGATPMAGITEMEQRLSQIETRLDKTLTLLERGEAGPTGLPAPSLT